MTSLSNVKRGRWAPTRGASCAEGALAARVPGTHAHQAKSNALRAVIHQANTSIFLPPLQLEVCAILNAGSTSGQGAYVYLIQERNIRSIVAYVPHPRMLAVVIQPQCSMLATTLSWPHWPRTSLSAQPQAATTRSTMTVNWGPLTTAALSAETSTCCQKNGKNWKLTLPSSRVRFLPCHPLVFSHQTKAAMMWRVWIQVSNSNIDYHLMVALISSQMIVWSSKRKQEKIWALLSAQM